MADPLLRHWAMLRLVPRAPRKVDSASLQAALGERGFEVDRRSIQRDLHRLARVFPLALDDSTKPFGWSWARDAAAFDLPCLEPQAALTLRLAHDLLADLLPASTWRLLAPQMRMAEAVLGEAGGLGAWPDKVRVLPRGIALRPPETPEGVRDTVYDALLTGRRFHGRYVPRGAGVPKEYLLNPLALVQRGGVSYLLASAWDYDAPLQFAMHRFVDARPSSRPGRAVEGFDLDDHIAAGHLGFTIGGRLIALQLRVGAFVAEHLGETPLSEDQVITEVPTAAAQERRYEVSAAVADNLELRWWLRGFGGEIEVVAPAELRAEMIDEARRVTELYACDADA